ncbi:MAG TPA: hypothetical protein ENL20_05110 [Candidatus Cloacimonetes bacterium]|nr:hypothetical protein [Candidatus Cloacimonadota bacterium]
MKYFISLFSVFSILFLNLHSLEIKTDNESLPISIEKLQEFEQLEITTTREKNDKIKIDIWSGVDLISLLKVNEINDFAQLKFISDDNYLVRLKKKEILQTKPIIALQRNGNDLQINEIRLVVPEMRDMFWIRNLKTIEVELLQEAIFPNTIFLAENNLEKKQIRKDPEPFVDVSGYFFNDLIENIFPFLDGEFLIVGRDGVQHNLDYQTYLEKASLIFEDGKYDLKSPSMPAGMWIKEIAYIQLFDRGILFMEPFENWKQIKELLKWNNVPDEFYLFSENEKQEKRSNLDFRDPIWEKALKIKWIEK